MSERRTRGSGVSAGVVAAISHDLERFEEVPRDPPPGGRAPSRQRRTSTRVQHRQGPSLAGVSGHPTRRATRGASRSHRRPSRRSCRRRAVKPSSTSWPMVTSPCCSLASARAAASSITGPRCHPGVTSESSNSSKKCAGTRTLLRRVRWGGMGLGSLGGEGCQEGGDGGVDHLGVGHVRRVGAAVDDQRAPRSGARRRAARPCPSRWRRRRCRGRRARARSISPRRSSTVSRVIRVTPGWPRPSLGRAFHLAM